MKKTGLVFGKFNPVHNGHISMIRYAKKHCEHLYVLLCIGDGEIDGNDIGSETAIEMVYDFQLNKYMHIKPDLQYVINPAGTDKKLSNALVGMLRFQVEF